MLCTAYSEKELRHQRLANLRLRTSGGSCPIHGTPPERVTRTWLHRGDRVDIVEEEDIDPLTESLTKHVATVNVEIQVYRAVLEITVLFRWKPNTCCLQDVIKTSEARRRQLERVESTFKENKALHFKVKAREDEIADLKEERTRLQARKYEAQLEKQNLVIDCDIARGELTASQAQLAKTGSQLATVAEERNGKFVDVSAKMSRSRLFGWHCNDGFCRYRAGDADAACPRRCAAGGGREKGGAGSDQKTTDELQRK